jgi:hypothetical protein
MAQGNLKLSKKKAARVTKHQKNPKAAAPKLYKSKNVSLKEKQVIKLAKGHQAKLVSNTEKLISSRVGHLELLKGDRRTLEKEERLKAQAKAAKAKAAAASIASATGKL